MRHLQSSQHDGRDSGTPRRRWGYANVVSTLALVLALGGGTAWAAKHFHYLVTSTHQIKPSVLKTLHGAAGAAGQQGPIGPAGATGAAGAVMGLSASGSAAVDFTSGTLAHPTTILTRSLPGGSFLVNAKTVVSARTSTAPGGGAYVDDTCQLTDGSATDTAWWNTSFTPETFLGLYLAYGTLAAEIAVSSPTASTVTLACDELGSAGSGIDSAASYAEIQAVQTTANS